MSVRFRRLLVTLLRGRHVFLCFWLAWLCTQSAKRGLDWSHFTRGTDLLLRHSPGQDSGGLHVFANDPSLHMGPLSLLGAAIFGALFPPTGRFPVMVIMAAFGPAIVLLVERAAIAVRGLSRPFANPGFPLAVLIAGAAFLFVWVDTSWSYAHLDDVLVLVAAAMVVWCVATQHAILAGVAIGLAIGAKSMGILILPLLASFPRRRAVAAAGVAFVLAAAAWLPFLVADPGTIAALRAEVVNHPASALRVFGIDSKTSPPWLRPLQATAALALATVAVARGRWPAAIVVAVGVRLGLDAQIYLYYTAGLVFGGLVWDLVGARRPWPLWTLVTLFALWGVPRLGADPHLQGLARVGIGAACLLLLLGPRPSTTSRSTGSQPVSATGDQSRLEIT